MEMKPVWHDMKTKWNETKRTERMDEWQTSEQIKGMSEWVNEWMNGRI